MSAALESAVSDRKNTLVFAQVRSSLAAATVISFLLAWVLRGSLGALGFGWAALGLLFSAVRWRARRRFYAEPEAARREAWSRWRTCFARGAVLAALWWASLVPLVVLLGTRGDTLFTGFMLAGIVAGALQSQAAWPSISGSFTVPILGAFVVGALVRGREPLDLAMAIGGAVFVPTLLRSARLGGELIDRAVRAAFEQAALVADLEGARDAAVGAARARSEFLAVMSHEIRTPLNGVVGMSGLLRETALDVTQREYVDTLVESGEALQTLLNDILDVSKIDAGRLELDPHDVDLPRELKALTRLLSFRAQEKHLALSLDLAADVPRWVRVDWPRLRQVLLNLLGNGIKFTERGGVHCVVDALEGQVRFQVRDTGPGVSEAQRARLFEPFTQADATISRRYGGTGLGLSISRRLVELMGGALTLASRVGEGSTFTFSLALPVGEPQPEPAEPPLPDDAPARVLLVDDNEINLKLERTLLERAGHSVQVARNGEEALAVLAAHPFDLVLLDLQMPVLDGLETARRIRARQVPAAAELPLIALTANASVEDREASRAAGFDDFLTKPIAPRQLTAAVARRRLLRRAR